MKLRDRWYFLPELAEVFPEANHCPAADEADDREELVVLDYEGIDAFIASRDADYDVTTEAA